MSEQISLLQQMANDVREHGPSRVMIDEYEAVPPRRAAEQGIGIDVIFIRDDGWSLGAPVGLEHAAERTWSDHWVGVMRAPFDKPADPYIR